MSKIKRQDLTGQKFGKLTIKKMLYNYNDSKRTKCLCDCDCGVTDIIRDPYKLKQASLSSCGCASKEIAKKYFGTDVDGKTFGYLTVLETLWNETPVKVKCECVCGNIKVYTKRDVIAGHTKSCGCYNLESISKRNQAQHYGKISDYGVKILKPLKLNNKKQWIWLCRCACGQYFEEVPARVLNNHIRSCGCLKASARELYIENILKELNIKYKPQYTFENCKSDKGYVLRFDFALLNEGKVFYLLEYDGEQHYKPIDFWGGIKGYEGNVLRDKIKNDFCAQKGIPLLRLPYFLSESEIKEQITNIIYP